MTEITVWQFVRGMVFGVMSTALFLASMYTVVQQVHRYEYRKIKLDVLDFFMSFLLCMLAIFFNALMIVNLLGIS